MIEINWKHIHTMIKYINKKVTATIIQSASVNHKGQSTGN